MITLSPLLIRIVWCGEMESQALKYRKISIVGWLPPPSHPSLALKRDFSIIMLLWLQYCWALNFHTCIRFGAPAVAAIYVVLWCLLWANFVHSFVCMWHQFPMDFYCISEISAKKEYRIEKWGTTKKIGYIMCMCVFISIWFMHNDFHFNVMRTHNFFSFTHVHVI